MSVPKPTYHLPPNFSIPPPPMGPFHLGTLIRDFDRREQMRPLNNGKDRNGEVKRIEPPKNDVFLDHKDGFEAIRSRLKSGEHGLWARCIGVDGLGGEASISAKRSENDTYKFDSLDTEFFYPSPTYVSKCMALSDVDEYMKAFNYKRAVYLVTGLKVARGATVRMESAFEVKGKLDLGLNNPGGASVQVGPRTESTVESKPSTEFKGSSDLIIGIQCLKIYYKRGIFGLEKKLKDTIYTDGATFLDNEVEKQQEVTFDGFILVGPDNYNNEKFTPHQQATGEGKDIEIWMLPTESDQA
ncbi:hypothetical protein PG984_012858 [Apiospora sp. TS-2023a]